MSDSTDGGEPENEPLLAERKQAFKILSALLKRRDEHYEETGVDPLNDEFPSIIKAAGYLRDGMPVEKVPNNVDPSEVFGDGEKEIRECKCGQKFKVGVESDTNRCPYCYAYIEFEKGDEA